MLTFGDLSEEDQEQAVGQAIEILMVNGVPTITQARALAALAHYPEADDVILFLVSPESITFELERERNTLQRTEAAVVSIRRKNPITPYAEILSRRYARGA